VKSWVGNSTVKQPAIKDAALSNAHLNEPSGLWAYEPDGEFEGLYVADMSNNCIRVIDEAGNLKTLDIKGIPIPSCREGQC